MHAPVPHPSNGCAGHDADDRRRNGVSNQKCDCEPATPIHAVVSYAVSVEEVLDLKETSEFGEEYVKVPDDLVGLLSREDFVEIGDAGVPEVMAESVRECRENANEKSQVGECCQDDE